ncbi:MAG: hypothetical protein DMG29_15880 [Acidobacteria bacterium]|nr:MAG: hypothetical protein DMG29_15880 [Acidobacteriota bacterium]
MRQVRVPRRVCAQVVEVQPDPVLDLRFTQIVQQVRPGAELPEHFGHGARNQDVPRVSAVHHPLGDVDAPAGYVAVRVDIGHAIDRAGVDAHT